MWVHSIRPEDRDITLDFLSRPLSLLCDHTSYSTTFCRKRKGYTQSLIHTLNSNPIIGHITEDNVFYRSQLHPSLDELGSRGLGLE